MKTVRFVVEEDFGNLPSESINHSSVYYLGNNFNKIKSQYGSVINIGSLLDAANEKSKELLINLDSFFSNKLYSLSHSCTANRYLTELCDDVSSGIAILEVVKQSALEHDNMNIIIMVESEQKKREYQDFLISNCITVYRQSNFIERGVEYIKIACALTVSWVGYLKSYLRAQKTYWKMYFQTWKAIKTNNPTFANVNIITWVNDSHLEVKDLYSENRYFGCLPAMLKEKGEVAFIGHVLQNIAAFQEIDRRYQEKHLPIFFIRSLLNIQDIFYSLWTSFYCWRSKPKKVVHGGIDYSIFVKKSCNQDFFSGTFQNGILNYRLFMRLLAKVPFKSIMIYPFENQPWERALLMACAEVNKGIRPLAYQFFPMSNNFFIYAFSKQARQRGYLPSQILTSDELSNQIFLRQNLKSFPIGNFRYRKLLHVPIRALPNTHKKEIVCALFLDEKEALNLAEMALELTKNLDCRLWLNTHPMLSSQCVEKLKNLIKPYPHAMLSKKSITEFLETVSIVLYNSSSVCWEAALQGVPIVYVACDNIPNLDRFGSNAECVSQFDQGIQLIEKLFSNQQYYQEYSQRLYTIAQKMLFPIHEDTLEKIWA